MPGSKVPFEVGTEDYYSGSRIKYPNPFFSLSNQFLPKDIKTLFKYCRNFYYTNGFIRNIITKLTEYPITDILFESEINTYTKEKYNEALHKHLNIKQMLIEIGLDYYTFGNCFISANLNFKRYLKCNHCGHTFLAENNQDFWKFKNFEFHGKCPKCHSDNAPYICEDTQIKSIEALNFIRWAPEQITIDFDELTGQSTYYYDISSERKKQILNGNKKIVIKTPLIFLNALKEKKLIELDKSNLFHFKRPSLAEENQGWGKPAILPAIKDIYYMQTLQKGNEAVAHEHIVPKKAIFPAANGPIDPFQSLNLGKWRGQIEEQLLKWKRDPNHIGIFPIPIGYQQLGGDAKMLLLAPELRFLEENIITNMGLPLDFIKGGASWTGSSVSLRIVENHFLPYREMLTDFLNYFLIKTLSDLLNFPKIKVKLKDLKMTDDSESKQILINLNQMNKISQKTLLDKFGIDYEKEKNQLIKEQKDKVEFNKAENIAMALAQGIAQETLARHEARAQHAMQDEMHRLREEPFESNILAENTNLFMDSSKLIEMLALQLSMAPPEQQEKLYIDLAKRAPITASLVMERFLADQAGNPFATTQEIPELTKPGPGAPTKANKKEDQISPKTNKTKGASGGNPVS